MRSRVTLRAGPPSPRAIPEAAPGFSGLCCSATRMSLKHGACFARSRRRLIAQRKQPHLNPGSSFTPGADTCLPHRAITERLGDNSSLPLRLTRTTRPISSTPSPPHWAMGRQPKSLLRQVLACSEGCLHEAWFNLESRLLAQNRYPEARGCFLKALEMEPGYERAREPLADLDRLKACLARYQTQEGPGAGKSQLFNAPLASLDSPSELSRSFRDRVSTPATFRAVPKAPGVPALRSCDLSKGRTEFREVPGARAKSGERSPPSR